MIQARILLLALALGACAEPASKPVQVAGATSLPPGRTFDCVSLVLVDDKCTADWYSCRSAADADASCVRAWRECCRISGQGNRKRLGGVEDLSND